MKQKTAIITDQLKNGLEAQAVKDYELACETMYRRGVELLLAENLVWAIPHLKSSDRSARLEIPGHYCITLRTVIDVKRREYDNRLAKGSGAAFLAYCADPGSMSALLGNMCFANIDEALLYAEKTTTQIKRWWRKRRSK